MNTPSIIPSTLSSASPSNFTILEGCVDLIWMSHKALIEGNTEPVTCAEYSEVPRACNFLGLKDYSVFDDYSSYDFDNFTTALDACCVCGGGNRTMHEVSVSEEPVEELKCIDNPEFRTVSGHDCSYFTTYIDTIYQSHFDGYCVEWVAEMLILGLNFYSLANEECCICGGGMWNYQIEGEGGPTPKPTMSPVVERERPIRDEYTISPGCVDLRLWEDPVGTGCDWWRGFVVDHFKDYPYIVDGFYYEGTEYVAPLDYGIVYKAVNDGFSPHDACCTNFKPEEDNGGVFLDKIISVMEDTKVTCTGKNWTV